MGEGVGKRTKEPQQRPTVFCEEAWRKGATWKHLPHGCGWVGGYEQEVHCQLKNRRTIAVLGYSLIMMDKKPGLGYMNAWVCS